METMYSVFRGIWLVAEQWSRGALRAAGLHFAAALRLSGRGKSPGLRPIGGYTGARASGIRDLLSAMGGLAASYWSAGRYDETIKRHQALQKPVRFLNE